MIDALSQQIAEMVAKGFEPAGIVMTPVQLKRLIADRRAPNHVDPSRRDDRYTFEGLPIWRSWEISGPCVVTRDVLRAMRDISRWIPDKKRLIGQRLDPLLF